MLRRLLGLLFRQSACPPVRSSVQASARKRFSPPLESLETREVPAVFLWTGEFGTDATDPRNWCDYNHFGAHDTLPSAGDSLFFEASEPFPSSESTDCNGLTLLSGSFASIYIGGYTGTVTFGSAITTGTFDLFSGAIAQPTSGTDLTVTGTFTWTDGVLNSSSHEATVNILGGGSITLPTGGGLTCGSSLYFGSTNPALPTATTISGAGTLDFPAGSPITIEASSVTVRANANEAVKFTGPPGSYDDGKAKIELKSGGGLIIRTAITYTAENRIFVNNGGNLEIKEGATASFGSNALVGPPVGTPLKTDILQNSGTIDIHTGCTLTSAWGAMEVKGGWLYAVVDAGSGSTTSTIGCQFNFSGGTMRITSGFGAFKIKGDFYWTGGTFMATVDCAAGATAIDQIIVEQKMYVGGTATLQMLTTNYDPLIGLPNNFRKMVIRAKTGIAGIGNLAPSLTLQNPPGGATFQLDLRPDGAAAEYDLIPG